MLPVVVSKPFNYADTIILAQPICRTDARPIGQSALDTLRHKSDSDRHDYLISLVYGTKYKGRKFTS